MRYNDIPFSTPSKPSTARASGRVRPPKFDWTAERLAQLTELWATGLSAAAIGRALGCSKNSVVGKAHRLGLPARMSPIIRAGKPKLTRKSRLEAIRLPKPQPVIERPVLAYMGPQELCRFPIGDPKRAGFRFCDAPAIPGSPYCQDCHALCFLPPKPISFTETSISRPENTRKSGFHFQKRMLST